jgi:O-antigen/teichoic acid export membrane protein
MEKLKNFLFKNTSTKQTLAKNTFWVFASEALGRILKMILVIYAARILGASGWGVFSYAISIASLLMIFSDIGISDLVTREIVQKKDGYKSFLSTALVIKISILIISSLFIVFLGPLISHVEKASVIFPIIAIVLFFDALRELGLAINRAFEKMERDIIVKSITNTLILVLGIILINTNPTPKSVAIAYATGSFVGFLVIAFILNKELKTIISKFDKKIVSEVIKTTWPFALISLIAVIMGNTDVYMLGIWRDSTEIGLYSSVQRIWQFLPIIPTTFATTLLPILSREAHHDNVRFKNILEKSLSITFIVGIPITIIGIGFSDLIINTVFGLDYSKAIPILKIIMIMSIFSFPLIPLSNAVFAYNQQKSLMLAYISGIIINIAANFALIPNYGAIGSAVATLFSTFIVTSIVWLKMKKINEFKIFSKLSKAFFAAFVMSIVIILLKKLEINNLVNIAMSGFIYLGILIMTKESSFKEVWQIIKT